MDELATRCLDTFPEWLRTLATDAGDLAELVASSSAPDAARRQIAGGLNYLFKSLDLIPDGIEDLGFLDDAFVLRVSAATALRTSANSAEVRDTSPTLVRLAGEASLVAELLGQDFARLEAHVVTLTHGAARGRTVEEIIGNEQTRQAFLQEVKGWAASYAAPSFTRDEKNLVKLQSFLSAKLPSLDGAR
ncbi:MAG: DUF1232 domain-containing protein [Polyangiaceae bacterium]